MAIFHLNVVCHSRSQAHSAVAGAAYRSAERLVDERTGITHDYVAKPGVSARHLVLPTGVTQIARGALWNAVEAAENRKNSTVAREIEVSLPAELTHEAREILALGFAEWLVAKYNFAADISLHDPTKHNAESNFHAHIYTSTRALTATGFAEKVRILDNAKTGSAEVTAMREEWGRRVNLALAAHSISQTVDHRSHAARGLDVLPTAHEGNGPRAARIRAENGQVRAINALNSELAELLKQRAQLVAAEKVRQAADQARRDAERMVVPVAHAELEIERATTVKAARAAAESIATARRDRERALPRLQVHAAQKKLARALRKAKAAKAVLATLQARGAPWWAPWRKKPLHAARRALAAAQTEARDTLREARALTLEDVDKARRDATKALEVAQLARERIELQMLHLNDGNVVATKQLRSTEDQSARRKGPQI